MINFTL